MLNRRIFRGIQLGERGPRDVQRVLAARLPGKFRTLVHAITPVIVDQPRPALRQPLERERVGGTGHPGRQQRFRPGAPVEQAEVQACKWSGLPAGRRRQPVPRVDPSAEDPGRGVRTDGIPRHGQRRMRPDRRGQPAPPHRTAVDPHDQRVAQHVERRMLRQFQQRAEADPKRARPPGRHRDRRACKHAAAPAFITQREIPPGAIQLQRHQVRPARPAGRHERLGPALLQLRHPQRRVRRQIPRRESQLQRDVAAAPRVREGPRQAGAAHVPQDAVEPRLPPFADVPADPHVRRRDLPRDLVAIEDRAPVELDPQPMGVPGRLERGPPGGQRVPRRRIKRPGLVPQVIDVAGLHRDLVAEARPEMIRRLEFQPDEPGPQIIDDQGLALQLGHAGHHERLAHRGRILRENHVHFHRPPRHALPRFPPGHGCVENPRQRDEGAGIAVPQHAVQLRARQKCQPGRHEHDDSRQPARQAPPAAPVPQPPLRRRAAEQAEQQPPRQEIRGVARDGRVETQQHRGRRDRHGGERGDKCQQPGGGRLRPAPPFRPQPRRQQQRQPEDGRKCQCAEDILAGVVVRRLRRRDSLPHKGEIPVPPRHPPKIHLPVETDEGGAEMHRPGLVARGQLVVQAEFGEPAEPRVIIGQQPGHHDGQWHTRHQRGRDRAPPHAPPARRRVIPPAQGRDQAGQAAARHRQGRARAHRQAEAKSRRRQPCRRPRRPQREIGGGQRGGEVELTGRDRHLPKTRAPGQQLQAAGEAEHQHAAAARHRARRREMVPQQPQPQPGQHPEGTGAKGNEGVGRRQIHARDRPERPHQRDRRDNAEIEIEMAVVIADVGRHPQAGGTVGGIPRIGDPGERLRHGHIHRQAALAKTVDQKIVVVVVVRTERWKLPFAQDGPGQQHTHGADHQGEAGPVQPAGKTGAAARRVHGGGATPPGPGDRGGLCRTSSTTASSLSRAMVEPAALRPSTTLSDRAR